MWIRSLTDANGNELAGNGDITRGMDFWFFASDDHLPRQVENLPLHALFEQGVIGVMVSGFSCRAF